MKEIEKKENEYNQLKKEIEKKENEYNQLKKEKEQKENEYNQLKKEKDQKENEYNQLKKEIEKKENEYNHLKKEKEDMKNQLNNKIKDSQSFIQKLERSKIRFTMRSRCAPNKCMDTKNMNYGNSPHLWDYEYNNKNQIFELEKNINGTYAIKCSASGLYLGIDIDRIAFRKRNENYQSFYIIN